MINNRFPVLLIHNQDPTWSMSDLEETSSSAAQLQSGLELEGHQVNSLIITDANLAERLAEFHKDEVIVFNWCEELPGLPRSDVLVARILEDLSYAYTGSTPEILSLSWDKSRIKELLSSHALPTPRWRLFEEPNTDTWSLFPAIVKPSREHCSTGITIDAVVLNPEDLQHRVEHVLREFQQPALVEDFIDGREFHVTLWGNSEITILPPVEMDFTAFNNIRDRLCTYESKFKPGSAHYETINLLLPAPLSPAEYSLLEETSLKAYSLVGCRDFARIDLRLREGRFYVLDVNPNADISPDTSPILAAELAGYSYGAFCSRLIQFAAGRHPVFSKYQGD